MFEKYEASNFGGGARSYAAQGVCSICKRKPATWMKGKRAYCEDCKKGYDEIQEGVKGKPPLPTSEIK